MAKKLNVIRKKARAVTDARGVVSRAIESALKQAKPTPKTPEQRIEESDAVLREGDALMRSLGRDFDAAAASPVRISPTGQPMPEGSPGTGIAVSPDSFVEARDFSVERADAAPTPVLAVSASSASPPGAISTQPISPMGMPQPMGPMGMPVSGKSIAASALGAAALYGLARLLAGRKSDETPARTNGERAGTVVSRKPIRKVDRKRGYKKGGVVKKRNVKKGAVRQTIKKMARKR